MKKDGFIVAISALLALAMIMVICIMVIKKNEAGNDDTTAEPGTVAPVVTTEDTTQAPDTTADITTEPVTTEPVTTEPVTTEEVTTEEVTTEEVTTEEVTTEPVTTEPVTTVAVTTSKPTGYTEPEVHEWVPTHIEGSELIGYSTKGYAIEYKDGCYYVGGIWVVNKTYTVPSDFVPQGYSQPASQAVVINTLTSEANTYYLMMKEAFKAQNPKATGFKIQSGYRSYATQEGLYSRYVKNQGQAAADTYSARPGHSEHQTGLAADINVVGTSTLYESIKNTTEGKWLAANSWKYGFILRYPEGKTPETGYIYEPWHFRYIGVDAAAAVYKSGLCLEEFLGIDSVYKD